MQGADRDANILDLSGFESCNCHWEEKIA
jgi:hypothetical protein